MVARGSLIAGMNDTIRKFGYPETLIEEFDHWLILLRPAQPTLGSLILAAKSDVTSFADLPDAAFAELAIVSRAIETALAEAVAHEKLNYLMLMMVDPHVHYHVIPRYDGTRTHDGVSFADHSWPKLPDLAQAVTLDGAQIATLTGWLKPLFS
jgi:diadenosine tetraphosphate (Ap4A) HIT family hydrolase